MYFAGLLQKFCRNFYIVDRLFSEFENGFSNILTQRNNAPYNSTISSILKI